jgi:hypothetical protein
MFVRTEADVSEANREAIRWPRTNRPSRVERRSSRRRPSARNERRPIGDLRQVHQQSLGALTERFRDATKKSVAAIIERGRVLIDGKDQLNKRGQFGDWLVLDLHFGEKKAALRKAEFLMQLSRNDVMSNPCHWHDLPPSPRTLWELTQINPKDRLLKLIADGTITSAMTREEAMLLRRGGGKGRSPVPKLKPEVALLTDVCIRLGGGDAVRAHLRSLKIAPEVPANGKFDGAVRWVKQRLAKERGAN